MKIRFKLLLPLVIAGLLIWSAIALVWQPIFVNNQREEYLSQQLKNLQLLSHHLEDESRHGINTRHDLVTATAVLEQWRTLNVFGKNGELITSYSTKEKKPQHSASVEMISYHLVEPHSKIKKLEADIDLSALEAKTKAMINSIELTILGLTFFSIALASFIQDSLIIRPLKKLASATADISQHKDSKELPIDRNDEVGDLARSFCEMEKNIHDEHDSLVREVNLSRESEQKTQLESLEYLQAIIENVVDGIITIDQKGMILSYNPAAERIFGYDSSEVLGHNISMFIDKEDEHKKHDQYINDYVDKNKEPGIIGIGREVSAKRKSGETFPMDLAVSQVDTRSGVHFVGIIRDISKRKQIEEDLYIAHQEAEKASELKSKFLANISHEIRTPMNGILGMMDILRQTPLSKEQQQYTDVATRSGDALLNLLNDLLDISKIESGKIDIEYISFNLNHLLSDITHLFKETATIKGIDFKVDSHLQKATTIFGDPTRIRQVVNNLLSNAIKFTQKGGVEVGVYTQPLRAPFTVPDALEQHQSSKTSSARLTISVRDSGIGVNKESLQSIFNPFEQADNSTTRLYGGTGLGLSISKELSELMGGELSLESELGKGSEFNLSIPILVRENQPDNLPQISLEQLRNAGVIIFGNNHRYYNTILPAFKKQNIRFTLTNEIEECLRLLSIKDTSKKSYSLVLLDFNTAGIAVSQRIRANSHLDTKKIIAISHTKGRGEANMAKNLRINAYLPNNISIEKLIIALQYTSGQTGKNELITQHSIAEVKKMNSAKILVVEDNEVNQKVVAGMLKKIGYELTLAENGQEALEMLEKEDFDLVLMDLQMPVMDGFSAAREIRELTNHNKSVPILALSADAATETVERCLNAGMNGHISKPLQLKKLESAVVKWAQNDQ